MKLLNFNIKSDLAKYVLVLMSGTMIAQTMSYFFAPLITRLYTPEQSAELGIFSLIVAIGGALATARYELALPIVKANVHSYRLYLVALRITIIVSVFSCILVVIPFILGQDINRILFYILLPIALFSTAMYNIGTNWAIRLKLFKSISLSKISSSITSNISKVIFGWYNLGYIGLIFGATIGLLVSNIWFFKNLSISNKLYRIKSNSPRNFLLAKQFKEFPKINLPHTLMDLGRDLLIAILLLQIFSKEDYGLYDLSYRMLKLPLMLAGAAIGQVFFQKCAEKINRNEDVLPVITKAVKTLIMLSIVPFSVVFLYGEELFSFVFGESWRGAGSFSEIMAPWFMLNFIISPITSLPLILRKQRSFFIISIFGSVTLVLSIILPQLFFAADIYSTLWIMSITQVLYLLVVVVKIFSFVKESNVNRLNGNL